MKQRKELIDKQQYRPNIVLCKYMIIFFFTQDRTNNNNIIINNYKENL